MAVLAKLGRGALYARRLVWRLAFRYLALASATGTTAEITREIAPKDNPLDLPARSPTVPQMPVHAQSVGFGLLVILWFILVSALVVVPALVWGRSSRPPGPEPGPDDGWGPGPRGPSTRPDAPRGGIPLRDTEPARARLRDHHRLADLHPARKRRSAREPDRRPARKSPAP